MQPKTESLLRVRYARWILAVLAISAVTGLWFVASARAQTPAETQATPAGGEAVLRLTVAGPPEPIAAGSEFKVQVSVDNVQHLGAFEFSIGYDPAQITYERVEDKGKFLSTGKRGGKTYCPDPEDKDNAVHIACTTLGAPLCLGGLAGASGSGLLATAIFKSKVGGTSTKLDLHGSTLLTDDLSPCDPTTGATQDIAHRAVSASVQLAKGGGSGGNSTLLITLAVVVVAVVVVGGFAGLAWRRRRGAAP